MSEKRFVLGVDLDGVCGDFYAALRPIAAEWTGAAVEQWPADVSWGLPEWPLPELSGQARSVRRPERTLIDGPFAAAKELPGGYWLRQVRSLDEALEWRARFDGGIFEVRQILQFEGM
jgi:YCII-related domain-containing protein/deoxypyrimidine-specific 5' nucleotidase type C protein (NT5C)